MGIAIITASLVILLSAFNGIEQMIEKLYSEYDTDITIVSNQGKTFDEDEIDLKKISSVEGVVNCSKAIDEIVVLKHEKKWVNAQMTGIDSSFLDMTNMSKHMVDGETFIKKNGDDFGIIGASLLDKLGGFIPDRVGYESIQVFAPKRDAKVRLGSNPFKSQFIQVAGRMNFNREVNAERIVVSIDLAKDLLNYGKDISAVYVDVKSDYQNEDVKKNIQQLLGKAFVVKTNYEKNELIYKTSKSEKIIVIVILVFIFILAAFNLIASLTMLFVEKKDNLKTLTSMGADHKTLFNIFFYEGLLISGKGILFGLILGYAVCFFQVYTGVLSMPNSGGEAFPIAMSYKDGLLILALVCGLSLLFSYLPVKMMMKKHIEEGDSN
ncbi:MAG: ABC transporter permease [Crocinitomicaceae bacterium]|nr:ABC transporter permease [Crocinitomicaceae bacterium]MDP4866641.1 ABC transporter permease [Crocinitomicaceae bacterium]